MSISSQGSSDSGSQKETEDDEDVNDVTLTEGSSETIKSTESAISIEKKKTISRLHSKQSKVMKMPDFDEEDIYDRNKEYGGDQSPVCFGLVPYDIRVICSEIFMVAILVVVFLVTLESAIRLKQKYDV